MLKIKYDIVGSFLRPEKIKEARAKYFNQEIDLKTLRKIEDDEIAKLVDKQVAHGLKLSLMASLEEDGGIWTG